MERSFFGYKWSILRDFPGGSVVKESACQAGDMGWALGRKIPWEREWLPTPVCLAWKIPWAEDPDSQRGQTGPSSWSESESHSVVSDSLWPHGLYSPWNSPGQNTRVGSLSLLNPGIFPTQGSNPGLTALQVGSLLAEPQGKPLSNWACMQKTS